MTGYGRLVPVISAVAGPGMACLRAGAGPPLVFLPGLTADHGEPLGMDRRFHLLQFRPYTARRRVWWINRRPGLEPGVTMADLAADYASALRSDLRGPADVLGVSTGGSVALQLAVDHPDLVRRLVVVSAAYRLGPGGRAAQRAVAELLRAGRVRQAAATVAAMLGAWPVSRLAYCGLGWLAGARVCSAAARTCSRPWTPRTRSTCTTAWPASRCRFSSSRAVATPSTARICSGRRPR
ncbi:MAG: alpha/beta fold hydrolase [Kribbellaceae bacterium]